MRFILLALFTALVMTVSGQITIVQPTIYYVSTWQLSTAKEFSIGRKVIFRQECNPEVPADIVNGIVFMENVNHEKDQFSMAIEFKDTVVVAVSYYLSAKQADLLKTIGYANVKATASAKKREWIATLDQGNVRMVMVGDRKKITVIQTLK